MYAKHQPIIADYAKQSPDKLSDVYTFILATIQQRLYHVPRVMRDIRENGSDSPHLWGFKYQAYKFMKENKRDIYDTILAIQSDHDRLTYVASLPGLGLVKAGFLLQLVFGEAGCLDTHNINRFGLKAGAFKASSFKMAKTSQTRERLVANYLDLCHKLGGSEGLWNSWCSHVADVDPDFVSADQVSAFHVEAIVN